ncbi:MAG: DegT/DnrJ/EryC1/StrS aminotransferase [Deltaproteobacteria bacterium RBG_16_48_10]|nr:MAG: DegT/DnrJ/EryC1/StrS aminotransferase [Deltaproteobacteria bacterium RBG_16_48_10]
MRWKYPLSDIDLGKEEERKVLKVLRSRWLSTGPVTERFEKAFSEFLGKGEAIAVSNGTAALHLALASLGLKEGDEVILPSFTFVATANAVLYNRAKPIFADILGFEDLNISSKEIEKKITQKTKAIVVMHYGGYPCEMEAVLKIANRYGLPVVEDAAHAPGSEYRGQKCGTLGRLGCFSFFSNKNLVTGEGGMVFTRDQGLARRIRTMRSHGMTALSWDKFRGHLSSYDIEVLGYNYRITEIQSILGLAQLKKLERNNRRRKKLVEAYRKGLRGIPGIFIPSLHLEGPYSYHLFSILLDGGPKRRASFLRDQLMNHLRDLGIQTSIHYPPVHLFSLYRKQLGCKTGMLPMTEAVSQRVMTLPLHPRMDVNDVKWIAQKVKEIVRRWI